MAATFTLSLAAVDVLGQALGIDCRMFPFRVPSLGELEEDRLRIADAVLRDLVRRGLAHESGLDRDLRRAMTLHASGAVAVALAGTLLTGRGDPLPLRARASAVGQDAVLVVQDREHLHWERISARSVPSRMAALLPDLPPGPGHPTTVSLPAGGGSTGERAGGAERETMDGVFGAGGVVGGDPGGGWLRDPGPGPLDSRLRSAAAALSRPRTGTGYFVVTTRGADRREDQRGTVSWIDTDLGRYAATVRNSHDGATATFAPADPTRLATLLASLVPT